MNKSNSLHRAHERSQCSEEIQTLRSRLWYCTLTLLGSSTHSMHLNPEPKRKAAALSNSLRHSTRRADHTNLEVMSRAESHYCIVV